MLNKKALVTGGAGFIGSHLVDLLVKQGIRVVIIDNLSTGKLSNLGKYQESNIVKILVADISDQSTFDALDENFDYVFHIAALADIVPSISNPAPYYSSNLIGTLNLLEYLRRKSDIKLVFAASSSCYGIPSTFPTPENAKIDYKYPYAHSKYLAESTIMHYASVFGLKAISLRLFNVYGKRARSNGNYGAVMGVFLAQCLAGQPLTVVGDGSQLRDFVHVEDVARAFLMAAESDLSNQVFNIGSGKPNSIGYLASLIGGEIEYIPWRPGEPSITHANIEKVTSELKWKPEIKFEDGINDLLLHIEDWKDAPIWDRHSIKEATANWFKYLPND
jgi:UDP-glucose 4-epimerase